MVTTGMVTMGMATTGTVITGTDVGDIGTGNLTARGNTVVVYMYQPVIIGKVL